MKIRMLTCCSVSLLLLAGQANASTMTGDGVTPSTDITGKIVQALLDFSMNVTDLGGDLSQHVLNETYMNNSGGNISNGIDQVSSNLVNIQCLSVSSDKKHVWWSGTAFFGTPDPRVNAATNQQSANDIASYNPANGLGNYLFAGRIDAPVGGVQTRSIFINGANYPEVSLNDAGTISSNGGALYGATGANMCKLQEAMFDNTADFVQLNTRNGKTGCVTGRNPVGTEKLCDIQWLTPDDSTNVGQPQPNVPSTFTNPPQQSIYSLRGLTRTFSAGLVKFTK